MSDLQDQIVATLFKWVEAQIANLEGFPQQYTDVLTLLGLVCIHEGLRSAHEKGCPDEVIQSWLDTMKTTLDEAWNVKFTSDPILEKE